LRLPQPQARHRLHPRPTGPLAVVPAVGSRAHPHGLGIVDLAVDATFPYVVSGDRPDRGFSAAHDASSRSERLIRPPSDHAAPKAARSSAPGPGSSRTPPSGPYSRPSPTTRGGSG